MNDSSHGDWMNGQIEFWNQRAHTRKGTGSVPFRTLEFDFICSWVRGRRVLDAGCGSGEVMTRLKVKRPELSLVGLDFATQMLNLARRASHDVVRMNLLEMALGDGGFDTVIAIRALKNILDTDAQAKALKELCRVANERVILVDSIQETGVTAPPFNLYLSRSWLVGHFRQEGFGLAWEEYFRMSCLRFPIIASSRHPQPASDEGFFVFDRGVDSRLEVAAWKLRELTRSVVSLYSGCRNLTTIFLQKGRQDSRFGRRQ